MRLDSDLHSSFLRRRNLPVFPVDGPMAFRLRLSNHEIASRIGSVRDVVSRAFARLRHEGLIAMEDREITVPDVPALKLYAEAGLCRPGDAAARGH